MIYILLSTLVYAKDPRLFFGLGLGSAQGTHSSENVSTSVKGVDDVASYSTEDFYVGLIYDNNRIQMSYTSLDVFAYTLNTNEKFTDINTILKGLDVDYIKTTSLFKSPSISIDGTKIPSYFKPFFLIGLGAYTGSVRDDSLEVEKDITGLAFNYGVGIYLLDSDHMEWEVSYKGKMIEWFDISHAGTKYSLNDNIQGIYFSFKIIF